jgi:hypothetical protein
MINEIKRKRSVCFGSNLNGNHLAAGKTAYEIFGAYGATEMVYKE